MEKRGPKMEICKIKLEKTNFEKTNLEKSSIRLAKNAVFDNM